MTSKLPSLVSLSQDNTGLQNEEDRIKTEIQCIRDIILNDNNKSKKELDVTVDRIHVHGAVLFSCEYNEKKVPVELNLRMQGAAKRKLSSFDSHDLDVMDLNLLEQEVALLWGYWGIIQAGDKYEKIARLCPIFVREFLKLFGVGGQHFEELDAEDADWLHLPGMRNAIPSTPNRFATNTSTWKDTYMERLRYEISQANRAWQTLGKCSSLICDANQLKESKEKLEGLLERVDGDSQEHEFLLHMLHDLYDNKVKTLQNMLRKQSRQYSWAQFFQIVLTRQRTVLP